MKRRYAEGVIGRTKADFDRSLFVETYEDLRGGARPSATPYRVLRSSLLLRQLLKDGFADSIAMIAGLEPPTFRYRQLAFHPELLAKYNNGLAPSALDPRARSASETSRAAPYAIPMASPTDSTWKTLGLWSDWLVATFDKQKAPIVSKSANKFRHATLPLFAAGRTISVEQLYSYIGYCMGGVHKPRASQEMYEEAITQLIGGSITRPDQRGGKDEVLAVLQIVSLITLRGLRPMYLKLANQPRLLSWWPHAT